MGNALVATQLGDRDDDDDGVGYGGHHGHGGLATVAVSKYLKLDRSQILKVREVLASRAMETSDPYCSVGDRKNGKREVLVVERRDFQAAMDDAGVRRRPDQRVLHLLFTMWEAEYCFGPGSTGTAAPYRDFVVGLSPLACARDESLANVLKFAVRVSDDPNPDNPAKGLINSDGLMTVIKSEFVRWAFVRLNFRLLGLVSGVFFMSLYLTHHAFVFPLLLPGTLRRQLPLHVLRRRHSVHATDTQDRRQRLRHDHPHHEVRRTFRLLVSLHYFPSPFFVAVILRMESGWGEIVPI